MTLATASATGLVEAVVSFRGRSRLAIGFGLPLLDHGNGESRGQGDAGGAKASCLAAEGDLRTVTTIVDLGLGGGPSIEFLGVAGTVGELDLEEMGIGVEGIDGIDGGIGVEGTVGVVWTGVVGVGGRGAVGAGLGLAGAALVV